MHKVFNKYILRTPLLPINYYNDLTAGENITDEKLLDEFKNPIIKEALFLASPVLFKEMVKWSENKILDPKDINKIKISFLKYLSRLSSRATPFGLFSGSALGNITDQNNIEIDDARHARNTRLDMNLTGKLIKGLEQIPEIKDQLLYYPNTSLYNCGDQLRYVESSYKDELLTYQIVEIDDSEYITKILEACGTGLNISDLSDVIIFFDADINRDDAIGFIHDLIDNQILISELEQTVSGEENINQLLSALSKIKNIEHISDNLQSIKEKLLQLDSKVGNNISDYQDIIGMLGAFNISFNEKYIFQTDLIIKTKSNFLNSEVKDKLIDGLTLLNKITPYYENTVLLDFKKAYAERYENREMPLLTILDNEIGLGYPIKLYKDVNPLIDDISFNGSGLSSSKKTEWTFLQKYLLKKFTQAIKENQYSIELEENDFKDLTINWEDLPDTFSSIIQIAKVDGDLKILMPAVAGSSAANLLGRFCHCDAEINDYVNEICAFEEQKNHNKIVAEIIHLPEDRVGNVLMRPSFRNFEIPYLSKSLKDKEKQIALDDILISVVNDKVILKSKKRGKEIIPRLTTAHNFDSSSLPAYRFLCDMQNNERRNFIGFDIGIFGSEFSFTPRIVYKEIILSTAKWKIDIAEIESITKSSNKENIVANVKKWATDKNIPQFIYYIEGDHKLLINLHNLNSIEMFFATISNKSNINIEEFLFDRDGLCKNADEELYVNEFIVSFYNENTVI